MDVDVPKSLPAIDEVHVVDLRNIEAFDALHPTSRKLLAAAKRAFGE